MRILFLTGCVEPGRDGVGDYTRHLAAACAQLGVRVEVISIADRYVATPVTVMASEGIAILRLPTQMTWRARRRAIRERCRAFAPDWISAQFVPFSFHRWGLAGTFVRALPRLSAAARLHVMFHEIWIGPEGSWRQRAISHAQRRSVVRLGRDSRTVIHTSNPTYQRLLERHGVSARVLPLFGSIPLSMGDAMEWLGPRLAETGCDVARRRGDWWLFAMFGTLHPVWPAEPLMTRLDAAAMNAGKRIAIVAVGGIGSGESLWRRLESRYGRRVPMLYVGPQPAARVSQVFNTADFGIAATPYALLGKSASAAAMLDHGLPLIVNREEGGAGEDPVPDPRDRALVIRLGRDFEDRLLTTRRATPRDRREDVARALLADLDPTAVAAAVDGAPVGVAR